MVDPARVRTKLAALMTYRDELLGLSQMDEQQYLSAHRFQGRYLVQAAAQVCIDVANHIIASEGWTPATELRQAFERLGEHDVLDPALVERLQDLTGLRNRLVHLYDDVDDRRVQQAIKDRLDDLDAFAAAVARLMDGGQ